MSQDGRMSDISFRAMALWLRLRERSLDAESRLVEAGVSAGQVVLDYGCGIGSYTIPAARMVGAGGVVYALDIHPLAIATVERRAKQQGLANVKTIHSGLDTGLGDSSVDTVLLYDVFHSVPDRQALLRELCRVLVPGGRLSVLPDHMAEDDLLLNVNGGNLFRLRARHGGVFDFVK